MGKALRYIIVLVLAACYFLPRPGCLVTMQWPAHVLHHFFHANVFHFAVNAVAAWALFDPRTKPSWWLLPIAFILGSFSYCFAVKPVIGFSNIIFAAGGLRTPSFSSSWWRSTSALVFFGAMLLMFFLPQFSATTHLVAYVIGVGIAACIRFFKGLDYDTGRATGSK